MNLLKGHHCWVLRAFASAFAHRRACRRSHEYSGDPFDPRRLLTVALYDNCSSQIALASACQRAALWDLANCETWYSKTRGGIGSIVRPARPAPKESWRRRGAVQLASRTAHTRRQRNSTIAELCHTSQRTSCTRPRHKSRRVRRPAQRQLESLQQQLHRFGTTRARPRRAPYNASAPP